MLSDKVYQEIFNGLSMYLPEAWEKLVVYLEHGEDSYSYSFYVKENNEFKKCFDIKEITEDKLFSSFNKIARMVSDERSKMAGEIWSNMTMVVDSQGKMKTDFDYTDLSIGSYQYKKEWKKRYLN